MTTKKTPSITLTIYLAIFLIAGGAGCFLRLFPLRHYVSNNAWDQASAIIMNNASQQIQTNIEKHSNNTTAAQKKQILNQQLNDAIHRNSADVKLAIFKLAKKIDEANPPQRAYPYLLASDSYHYYDLTCKLQETGRFTPKIKGSKYFHPQMSAPDGYWEPLTLHPYIGLGIHKILSLFEKKTDIMFSVSFTPLLLMALSLLCFLIIACRLKASPWAVLITALYFISIPIFLKRSMFGWYDNDPYNVFFPMLLMMILTLIFQTKTKKKKITLGLFLAAALVLYSLFWQGWVFVSVIIAASLAAVTLYEYIKRPSPERPKTLLILGIFIAGSLLGISLVFGFREIFILFQEGWDALQKFFNTSIPVWPDNYITVGELERIPLNELIQLIGGPFVLCVAALGCALGAWKAVKTSNPAHNHLWLSASLFGIAAITISLGAQRFALLAVTPLTLLFLLGMDNIVVFVSSMWKKFIPKKCKDLYPAFMSLFVYLISTPQISATEKNIPSLLNPIYNNTWNDALIYIKEHTPENAIINSWWSPGHFIKAIAKRRVIFDGASISSRQGYWLANALIAKTETEAVDYFRLLNNSGNRAADLLLQSGMTDSEAVSFLTRIIHLPEEQAQKTAQSVLPEHWQELLSLTHGPSDPVYLFVYNEMIKNLLIYPFVARWDFQKIEHLNAHPELQKNIPSPRSLQEYIEFLWNIVGGKPTTTGLLHEVNRNGPLILFSQNLTYDTQHHVCQIKSPNNTIGIPQFLFYSDGDQVIKKALPNANLPYSVLVGKRYNRSIAILLDPDLAESLLIRLYFFGDVGLEYITRVYQTANLTRQMQIDLFQIKTGLPEHRD